MKKIYLASLAAALLISGGCSKDDPFAGGNAQEGQILKSALSVDVKIDNTVRQQLATRAESDYNLDDFNIVFTREGETAPAAKYVYGEMPDVVVLPAGTYTVTATCGEDRVAEWDNPYFLGLSESFEVNPNEITSYVAPIECRLNNVMVSVVFDPSLASVMSDDSYVEVHVGDGSSLNFTSVEAAAEKAGYFHLGSETTLAAVFHGTVNGATVVETKALQNIEKGNHYRITFKLHSFESGAEGDAGATVVTDATVTVTDLERNVEVAEDEVLDDSERPTEGNDPTKPDQPDQPDEPTGEAPVIVGVAPIDIDKVNEIKLADAETTEVKLKVTSTTGITAFKCDNISDDLTADELGGMGLTLPLDLAETGDLSDPSSTATILSGMGFPVNVKGEKEVNFTIGSLFVGLMSAFGDHQHQFKLTVTDANGTTVKTLTIKFVN